MLATKLSWTEEYVGKAWKMLHSKIQALEDPGDTVDEYYAPFFTLVQSSGMGKSRLIDEYSKRHIVIPLCLRSHKETGDYPISWLAVPVTQLPRFSLPRYGSHRISASRSKQNRFHACCSCFPFRTL